MEKDTRIAVLEAKTEMARFLLKSAIGWTLILTAVAAATVFAIDSRVSDLEAVIDRNFDRVDTSFNAMDQRMDRFETRITKVEAQVSHVDSRVASVETQVANVDSRVAHVEAQVALVLSEIQLLRSERSTNTVVN